ncbi:ABC1-domain-containing protein [Pleurostoma richardsiae]|uniref:ABC1-domain-containing protein n=1 Tax=Pleurostoma richardsiae TaxID=41990 RepID=A0AA38RCD2_9PEZI|nr:ABC1-domain-containing protein [Pleurostoma richardsiae]
MGLVDFVIDLAAVLNASRSVASKHVALRARQLERYNRTSTVTGAFRQDKSAERQSPAAPAAEHPGSDDGPEVKAASTPAPESPRHEPVAPESSAARATTGFSPNTRGGLGWKGVQPVGSGSGAAPTAQPVPPPGAIIQELKHRQEGASSTVGTASQDKRPSAVVSDSLKTQLSEDDPVPDGVDLNVFRTQRMAWRAPPSKDTVREDDDSVPPGVNLNIFRTSRVSKSLGVPKEQAPPDPEKIPLDRDRILKVRDEPTASNSAVDAPTDAHQPVSSAAVETSSSGVEVPNLEAAAQSETPSPAKVAAVEEAEKPLSKDVSTLGGLAGAAQTRRYELRESKVPSSRIGRMWNYGGLAAGMLTGALSESLSRGFGGGGQGSVMLSAANMERLVSKLSKMRGAALKMGQMMSFQDAKMLPAPIQEVLQRVQDRADYMPAWQRDRVLASNLGADWRDLFDTFEDKPIAAASIGQVHRATLKSTGAPVAVKIQFPGVADSINSDLDNLGILLSATKLLPKGLYLNKTIDNARTELAWECDYEREAVCGQRFRELLADDEVFIVPRIYPEASGKHVLTMEFMEGVGVTRIKSFSQEQRDWIGTQILRLCLKEITEFKFMQTDPNWTNFLYNSETQKLELLDFGASREYPEEFISRYIRLLEAASRTDRDAIRLLSQELGYLTGHESKAMLDAHIASILTLAEPFLASAPEVYDFEDQTITERVKAQIPVMIKERLAPPPEETYSLHRKLSGAFLLCARLGSKVRCRELFEQSVKDSGILQQAV